MGLNNDPQVSLYLSIHISIYKKRVCLALLMDFQIDDSLVDARAHHALLPFTSENVILWNAIYLLTTQKTYQYSVQ